MKRYLWLYSLQFYLDSKNRIIYPGLIKDFARTKFFEEEYEDVPILLMRSGFIYYVFSDRPLQIFSTPRTRPKYMRNGYCLVLDTQALGKEAPPNGFFKKPSDPVFIMNKTFIRSFLSSREDTINYFLDLVYDKLQVVWETKNYDYLEALNTGKY